MGYCTVDDVKAEFGTITFDSTAKMSQEQVEDAIAEESALMDSVLGLRYVAPVSIPDVGADPHPSMILLRRICKLLVSQRVRSVIEVKSNESQTTSIEKARDPFDPRKELEKIATGKLLLPGATELSKGHGVQSLHTAKPETYKPVFHVNKQQW